MRKLYEQDIIEILYGATLLGAGGGGSLKQGLDMIQGLKDDGEQIELDLLDVSEMRDDAYAVMVAGLGSPVAMLDPDMPRFGPDAVFAYRAFQKAFAAEGKKLEYLYSGEMGGFNTFTPMLVAILSDKDPAKRIKFVDADGNGRAVPELNTTINAFYDHPPTMAWAGHSTVMRSSSIPPPTIPVSRSPVRCACFTICVSALPHGA